MGRLFLTEYGPDAKFHLCRLCLSHIALQSSYLFHYSLGVGNNGEGGIFDKVVNVQVGELIHHREAGRLPHTVAGLYCLKCGNRLGWKYVKIPTHVTLVRPGLFHIEMGKMFMWDGETLVNSSIVVRDLDEYESELITIFEDENEVDPDATESESS